jgi:hypothetical protein
MRHLAGLATRPRPTLAICDRICRSPVKPRSGAEATARPANGNRIGE